MCRAEERLFRLKSRTSENMAQSIQGVLFLSLPIFRDDAMRKVMKDL